MYIRAMVDVRARGCNRIVFDLIEGGLDRIIKATPFFRVLTFLGIDRYCYTLRRHSYTSEISESQKEDFEQIELNLSVFVPCLKIYQKWLQYQARIFNQPYPNYFDILTGSSFKHDHKREPPPFYHTRTFRIGMFGVAFAALLFVGQKLRT